MSEEDAATPKIEHTAHIAMTSFDRRKNLEDCFAHLRRNYVGLTEYQEQQLRRFMDVPK